MDGRNGRGVVGGFPPPQSRKRGIKGVGLPMQYHVGFVYSISKQGRRRSIWRGNRGMRGERRSLRELL